tara:strand:+ start:1540 stop:2139 length:600 start_codon:yes stop_codon:yes gene_type:complete
MATKTAPVGFGRAIWNAVKGAHQTHGAGLAVVTKSIALPDTTNSGPLLTTDGDSCLYPIFTAPASSADGGHWKIESIVIENEKAITSSSHASNGTQSVFITGRDNVNVRIPDGALVGKIISNIWLNTNTTNPATHAISTAADPITPTVKGPENASPAEVFLAPKDCLYIGFLRAGAGHDTSAMGPLDITVYLRRSHPGR